MEKVAGLRLKQTRHAVVTPAQTLVGAKNIQRLFINHKTGNEEIELAVIVIIKPDGTGGPTRGGDTRFVGDVRECAVSVVAVQQIPSITRDVEIGPAIAVVITHRDPHAKSAAGHSGLVRYVGESAVVVVVIES